MTCPVVGMVDGARPSATPHGQRAWSDAAPRPPGLPPTSAYIHNRKERPVKIPGSWHCPRCGQTMANCKCIWPPRDAQSACAQPKGV